MLRVISMEVERIYPWNVRNAGNTEYVQDVVDMGSIAPVTPDEYESDEQTANHPREKFGERSQREDSSQANSYVEGSPWAANNSCHTCVSSRRQSITWKRGEQIGMGSFGKVRMQTGDSVAFQYRACGVSSVPSRTVLGRYPK